MKTKEEKTGTISFETATSEFLACSCRNDVMSNGFELINQGHCEDQHFKCLRCFAVACVDFQLRIINNEVR